MLWQYNYRLATGTVGTDDENIAQVLYSVNQMEKYANFTSSDRKALDETLGNVFFLIADAKVHLNRFLKNFDSKTDAGTSSAVGDTFDTAIADIRNIRGSIEDAELAAICAVFPKVNQMLLDIVPSVLALDAQAAGRAE